MIAQEARTVRLWPDVDAPGMVAAPAAPGDPGASHTTQTRGGARPKIRGRAAGKSAGTSQSGQKRSSI